MNMLADADLPEADDEFSYREDPRSSLVDLAYPPARILAAARATAADADIMQERLRHPLIPVANPYADADRRFLGQPIVPTYDTPDKQRARLLHAAAERARSGGPTWQRNPVIPLPVAAWSEADARWRRAGGLAALPEVVESKDNDPTVPLTRCPICRVLLPVLGKMPGRKS